MSPKRKRKAPTAADDETKSPDKQLKEPPAKKVRKPPTKKVKKQTPTDEYVKVDPAFTRARPSRKVNTVVAKKEPRQRAFPYDSKYLAEDELRPEDVFCGRNSYRSRQAGNQQFREHIRANVKRYLNATAHDLYKSSRSGAKTTMTPKLRIINEIIDLVDSSGGRFLEHDKDLNLWFIMERSKVEKKVGQSFRDCKKIRSDGSSTLALEEETAETKEVPPMKRSVISRTRTPKKVRDGKLGRPRKNAPSKATKLSCTKTPPVEAADEIPDLPVSSPVPEAKPCRPSSTIKTSDIKPNDVLVCVRPRDDDATEGASSQDESELHPDTHWPQPVYSYIVDEYSATFGGLSNTKQLALGTSILNELREIFSVRFLVYRPQPNNPVGEVGWRVMADSPARRKILDALLQSQAPTEEPANQDHIRSGEPCQLEDASPQAPSTLKLNPASKDCHEVLFGGQSKIYSEGEAAMFAPLVAHHVLMEKATLSQPLKGSDDTSDRSSGLDSSSISTPNRTTKMRLVSPEQATITDSPSAAPPAGFIRIYVEKLKPTDVIVYHHRPDDSPSKAAAFPTTPGSKVVSAIVELNYTRYLKQKGSADSSSKRDSMKSPSLQDYSKLASHIYSMLDERCAQFCVCVGAEGPNETGLAWYRLNLNRAIDWLVLQLSMAFDKDRRAIEEQESSPAAVDEKPETGSTMLPDMSDFQGVCQWLSPFAEYWNGDRSINQGSELDGQDPIIIGETISSPLQIPVGQLRHPGYLAFRWMLHETYRNNQRLRRELLGSGKIYNQCEPVKALMKCIRETGGRFVEKITRPQTEYVPYISSGTHWRTLDETRSLEAVSNRYFKTGAYLLHHAANWDHCLGGLDYRDICGCMAEGWNPHPKHQNAAPAQGPCLVPQSKNPVTISGAVGSQMAHFSPLRSRKSSKAKAEKLPAAATLQVPDLGDTEIETKDFEVVDDATKKLTNMKIYIPEKPGADWIPPRNHATSLGEAKCTIHGSSSYASAARHTNAKRHNGYRDQHIHVVPQECPDTRTFDSNVGLATMATPQGNSTDMEGCSIQEGGDGDAIPSMTTFGLFTSSNIYNGPELLERMESWGLAAIYDSVSVNAGSMISRTALNTQTSFSSTAPRISFADSDAAISTDTWDLLRSTSNLVSPAAAKQNAGDPLENMPEPPEFHASETFSQLWDTDPRLKFGEINSGRSIAILDDVSTESSIQDLIDRSRSEVSHAFC